jgi:hypothetical protein
MTLDEYCDSLQKMPLEALRTETVNQVRLRAARRKALDRIGRMTSSAYDRTDTLVAACRQELDRRADEGIDGLGNAALAQMWKGIEAEARQPFGPSTRQEGLSP